jgi:hypothetical protein
MIARKVDQEISAVKMKRKSKIASSKNVSSKIHLIYILNVSEVGK